MREEVLSVLGSPCKYATNFSKKMRCVKNRHKQKDAGRIERLTCSESDKKNACNETKEILDLINSFFIRQVSEDNLSGTPQYEILFPIRDMLSMSEDNI